MADGSISGVIDGHRYNRAVRLHKLLYKAFLRLAWKGFHPWLEQNHQEELKSSHEEADTRMLLHANHASQNGYQTIVIVSEDTDVMILCLGCCKKINCPLYQKSGTQNRIRYINISNLAQLLGDDLCDALIGLHAFAGSDSVSAFAG